VLVDKRLSTRIRETSFSQQFPQLPTLSRLLTTYVRCPVTSLT